MKKSTKMIDLGRKPASLEDTKAEVKKDQPYYPSMSLSTEHPIDFPKGHFMAKMKLKVKRSEASTDENGKQRHSYHLDIHGVHPQFEEGSPQEEALEDDKTEAKEDAAAALLHSMGRAREKKLASAKD